MVYVFENKIENQDDETDNNEIDPLNIKSEPPEENPEENPKETPEETPEETPKITSEKTPENLNEENETYAVSFKKSKISLNCPCGKDFDSYRSFEIHVNARNNLIKHLMKTLKSPDKSRKFISCLFCFCEEKKTYCKNNIYEPCNMMYHVRTVHEKILKDYDCKICENELWLSKELNLPEQNLHKVEKDKTCVMCVKAVKYLNHLFNFEISQFQFTLQTCNYCNAKFNTLHQLQKHQNRIHNTIENTDKKIKCNICLKMVVYTELKHHKCIPKPLTEDVIKVKCLKCNKNLSCNSELENHICLPKPSKSNTEDIIKVKCLKCNKNLSCNNAKKIDYHKLKKHNMTKCDGIIYKVIDSKSVENSEEKNWDLCVKNSTVSVNINSEAYKKIEDHKCFHCENVFETKSLLISHIRSIAFNVHKNSDSFKCIECKMDLKTESELISHVQGHDVRVDINIHKYSSPNSSKKFVSDNSTSLLKIKYKCEPCKKTFLEIDELKLHVNTIHQNTLPIFSKVGFLEKVSVEEENVKCDICLKTLKPSQLKFHRTQCHPKCDNQKGTVFTI